jgi:L-asparaginase/Glu-tRNA(Gln) amidotransferase subunit D
LALIISHCTAFRLLSRDRLSLPQLPNSIFFLKPNLLVAQTGSTIQLYNTTSKTVVETFTSDSADPQVQIAPDSNMILFKNNKSIFQIQKNK